MASFFFRVNNISFYEEVKTMNENVVKFVDSVAFVVTMFGAGYVILKLADKCSKRA
jgi:hypothetical protein